MEKMQESINKDLKELKNKHTETNNTITEIKNTLDFPGGSEGKVSVCSVGDPGWIPGFGRSPGERNDSSFQYSCLENPMDGGAMVLQRVGHDCSTSLSLSEEEKKKGYEKIFEDIIVENSPNMEKEIVNQVQEAQRVPERVPGGTHQDKNYR